MDSLDLNLLRALDVLLNEGSVTGAARRLGSAWLGLSTPAMSRTLARLPIRNRRPAAGACQAWTCSDTAKLKGTFVIRADEGFIGLFSAPLVTAIAETAPRVRLRFAPNVGVGWRPAESQDQSFIGLDLQRFCTKAGHPFGAMIAYVNCNDLRTTAIGRLTLGVTSAGDGLVHLAPVAEVSDRAARAKTSGQSMHLTWTHAHHLLSAEALRLCRDYPIISSMSLRISGWLIGEVSRLRSSRALTARCSTGRAKVALEMLMEFKI